MSLQRKFLFALSFGFVIGSSSLVCAPSAYAAGTKSVSSVELGEDGCDTGKNPLPKALRDMVFQHFIDYQMFAKKGILQLHGNDYLEARVKSAFEDAAAGYAKVLGRIPRESSGDPTCVTGMDGRELGTYKAQTNLNNWLKLDNLAKYKIKENIQTNYGLTQISGDRLTSATSSPVQHTLIGVYHRDDKAHIKTRNLFSYYQDIANQAGSMEAIRFCGTAYLFEEGKQGEAGMKKLVAAMDSIKDCSVGGEDADKGYVDSPDERLCYARWVTLCPNLNFDLGMIASDKYFAKVTLATQPKCLKTLRSLIDTSPTLSK